MKGNEATSLRTYWSLSGMSLTFNSILHVDFRERHLFSIMKPIP